VIQNFKAPDWIKHHARMTAQQVALIDLASGRQRTYGVADDRASRLAQAARVDLNLSEGDRVAVLMKNDIDVFEIFFACIRANLIFVPINWRLAPEEVGYIIKDCDAGLLIYSEEFTACANHLAAQRPAMRTWNHRNGAESDYEAAIAGAQPTAPIQRATLTDLCALIYTSGTTGRPKGARITHGMILWHSMSAIVDFDVDRDTRNLVVLPTFHTGGLNVFANPVFLRGATNVIMREFDAASTLATLTDPDLRITHLMAVPTMHQMLQANPAFEKLARSNLRILAVAGASCPVEVISRYADVGLELRQFWGMTEVGPICLAVPPQTPSEKFGTTGFGGLFAEAEIFDFDNRCQPSDEGELAVRGPLVCDGYWGTEAHFDENGWFWTGDAVRRDEDGFIQIVGRRKEMFISGGENVYPAEIERVLTSFESIADCAVIGIPHEKWGECGCAFIVRSKPTGPDAAELAAQCETMLARYKIPKVFVFLDALPRNASGKLLKHALQRPNPATPEIGDTP